MGLPKMRRKEKNIGFEALTPQEKVSSSKEGGQLKPREGLKGRKKSKARRTKLLTSN